MLTAAFKTSNDALTAMLAGNATVTLVSKATGARFTYKIKAAKEPKGRPLPPNGRRAWFVSLLSGPNNTADYRYIGMIREGYGNDGPAFTTTARSRVSSDSPAVKAITWAVAKMYNDGSIPANLEIWHEGSCCRCGRALTVPESIASALGPECAKNRSLLRIALAA